MRITSEISQKTNEIDNNIPIYTDSNTALVDNNIKVISLQKYTILNDTIEENKSIEVYQKLKNKKILTSYKDKLNSFLHQNKNNIIYNREIPNRNAITLAEKIITILINSYNIKDIFVDTHADGGIYIEITYKEKFITFETYNDDNIIIYSISYRFNKEGDLIVGETSNYSDIHDIISIFFGE